MCFGANCPICSLKSWRGCGSHVPSVLSSVPESDWCTCTPRFTAASNGKEYPPQAGTGKAASESATAEKKDEL